MGSYKKQSSVWLHETYAHELQLSSSSSLSSLSSSSSSWKRFNRRRRHSSPILLLSNKFAIKWRLRRSAVEAKSAAAILSNWLFVVQQKNESRLWEIFVIITNENKKTNTLNTKRILYSLLI